MWKIYPLCENANKGILMEIFGISVTLDQVLHKNYSTEDVQIWTKLLYSEYRFINMQLLIGEALILLIKMQKCSFIVFFFFGSQPILEKSC